jgi:ribosome small subunit-dependent GTPase A
LLLVVATDPSFSDMLLSRALVAAEQQGLRSIIVLNKCDLAAALPAARALLAPYIALGCRVIELSAKQDASPLLPLLAGESSVLVGQSGMGKSTLTNALVPGAAAATRELSTALDSGKHTTTHARRYRLPDAACPGATLIDSPGLQEFGLKHLTPAGDRVRLPRVPPFPRPVPLSRLPARCRARLRDQAGACKRHDSLAQARPLSPVHFGKPSWIALSASTRSTS